MLRNIYTRRYVFTHRTENVRNHELVNESVVVPYSVTTDFMASYSNARQKLRVLQVARTLSYGRHLPSVTLSFLSAFEIICIATCRVIVYTITLCLQLAWYQHAFCSSLRGGRQRMRSCLYSKTL